MQLFFFQLPAGFNVQGNRAEVADTGFNEQREALGTMNVEVGGQSGDLNDALELFGVKIIHEMGVLKFFRFRILSQNLFA